MSPNFVYEVIEENSRYYIKTGKKVHFFYRGQKWSFLPVFELKFYPRYKMYYYGK